LACGCLRAGDVERARTLYNFYVKRGRNVSLDGTTYAALIETCLRGEDYDTSTAIYCDMAVRGYDKSKATGRTVLNELHRIGDVKNIRKVTRFVGQ